jgi:hypothetical protein
MRLIRFLPGALAALLTLSAAAQTAPPTLTNAQVEAAKAAAAAVSGTLSTQSLQVDADGRPVVDASGKAQTQTSSTNTLRDSLRTFQGYTGVEGVQQLASPGNAGRTGLVKLNVNATFDFQCGSRPSVNSAGALVFRMSSCNPQAGVTLQLCDKPASGGTCATDSDFQSPVVVPPNVFSQLGDMQLGLGCNSTNSCRITVKGSYTVGGNDTTLKQQAQTAAQQADDSTVAGSLRKAVTNGDYAGKMTEIGTPLKACADANEASMANGTASTCDGQQTVTVSNSQSQPASDAPRQCLKQAVSEQTFTRSCTRTFPLTERITSFQYDKTATCALTESTETGTTVTTDSCAPTTDPATNTKTDPRSGLTKVGQTDRTCSKTVPKDGADVCVAWTWSEYWADTSAGTVLSQTASPSAVTGACDTNPLSETRTSMCQNNNWFGRTLAASECMVQMVDGSTGQSAGIAVELSYADKQGCGFCLTPQVGETCYGAPSQTDPADSCAGAQLDGCSLKTVAPRNYTGDGGLVSSQEETYECHTQTTTCVQWSRGEGDNTLSTNMTLGLENVRTGPSTADGSLNNALVGAAVLNSTAQGVEGPQSPAVPLIFSGAEMRCKRATGGIGQLFGRNCCSTDIERPISGTLTRSGCSLDDARLAAARRSHYAHYIGDYCSRSMRFPRRCLERTETYCTFQGILPRIVHEQGRVQLAQIAASGIGADVQRTPMSFNYYDSDAGSWSPEVLVNGVRVRAWQWPSYCANPELASQKLLSDPSAKDCPGVVSTWFAACDNASGCGTPPAEPEDGSSTWALHVLDPLQNVTTAVSRYAVVTGACSPSSQNCAYTVAAWPAGVGGKLVVSRDMSWPLYLNEQQGSANVSAQAYQMNNIADLMFRGYSTPGMATGALPATVRLDFSRDGGQTWTTHQLPTSLKAQEFQLPDSDVKVNGYCDATTNLCGFRFTGTTTVVGKPWGSAENPDCSGFTAGQLSAMDFGKMDLSEWLSTVLDKTKTPTGSSLVEQATKEFQGYNSVFSSGGTVTAKSSAPRAANFARAVPSEGFGPFNVKLVVSGIWPEITGDPAVDRDRVTRVDVDWGDCSVKESLSAVAPDQGTGFSGVHRFEAPNSYACLGNPQHNVTHEVKLTVYTTLSGVQNRVVQVENAWATFPGGKQNNDYVGSSATAQPSTTPPPPRP